MVIVVEDKAAEGYVVTWRTIFQAYERVMKFSLGDWDLDLPRALRNAINASGQVADRLLKAVRDGFRDVVKEVIGESRASLQGPGTSDAGRLLRGLEQNLAIPNGINAFRNLYGEPVFARVLGTMALPFYDRVVVLTDRDASFASFKSKVEELNSEGYVIDILLDVHGNDDDELYFAGGRASLRDVQDWRRNRGAEMRLNAVYMVSCWGSRFNQAWKDLGADGSNGSERLNYYVLLSPFVFLGKWIAGQSLNNAAETAYRAEQKLLNGKTFKAEVTIGKNPITGKKITASASVGVSWSRLMNKALTEFVDDPVKPVDNKASSRRVPLGDARRLAGGAIGVAPRTVRTPAHPARRRPKRAPSR